MTNTALDESQEKKVLKNTIALIEKQIADLLEKIEQAKQDTIAFSQLYDEKISGLNKMMIDLDRVLEKYTSISSHVDAHFPFSEASEAFDKIMEERQRELEEEYVRAQAQNRQLSEKRELPPSEEIEMKRLYRKLARLFHPDIQGGDATIMMQINKAYARGDLATLSDIESSHVPKYTDTHTLFGLTMRLQYLKQLMDNTKDELKAIRKNQMYKMLRDFLKKKQPITVSLEVLAESLEKTIEQKKEHIKTMKDAFEAMDTSEKTP